MHIDQYLRGGDRRSIGKANQLVERITADPSLLPAVIAALASPDQLVAMRAADVAEKISHRHIEWFTPHKAALLRLLQVAEQQEVVWHLAQIVPRLSLTKTQRKAAFAVFKRHLESQSRIVVAFSLQALVNLGGGELELAREASKHLRKMADHGAPSVQARARKLLRASSQQKGRE